MIDNKLTSRNRAFLHRLGTLIKSIKLALTNCHLHKLTTPGSCSSSYNKFAFPADKQSKTELILFIS